MEKINKEKITKRLKELIDEWENDPKRMQSGRDYEKTFIEMMRTFENEVFQQSVGKVPRSKNSKKKPRH